MKPGVPAMVYRVFCRGTGMKAEEAGFMVLWVYALGLSDGGTGCGVSELYPWWADWWNYGAYAVKGKERHANAWRPRNSFNILVNEIVQI